MMANEAKQFDVGHWVDFIFFLVLVSLLLSFSSASVFVSHAVEILLPLPLAYITCIGAVRAQGRNNN